MSDAVAECHTDVFGLASCNTVRQARAWLVQQGIAFRFHDFKSAGAPAKELMVWLDDLGAAQLVNRRGTTWRQLEPAERAAADGDVATLASLLAARPSLIRRPVVHWADGTLTAGFDPAEFDRRLRALD